MLWSRRIQGSEGGSLRLGSDKSPLKVSERQYDTVCCVREVSLSYSINVGSG